MFKVCPSWKKSIPKLLGMERELSNNEEDTGSLKKKISNKW